MKKGKKIVLLISAGLVILGLVLALAGYAMMDGDIMQANTVEYSENTHTITEPFESIRIHSINSDIHILPSSDGKCTVVCDDAERRYHTVSVENGTLTITQIAESEPFSIMVHDTPMLILSLPEQEYEALYVESEGSSVQEVSPDFTFQTAELRSSGGNLNFFSAVTGDLNIFTSSGNITLEGSQIGGNANVETISGSILLTDAVMQNLDIRSSSGDIFPNSIAARSVTASTYSGNIVFSGCQAEQDMTAQAVSGNVSLNDTGAGGELYLETTSSGNVELSTVSAAKLTGRTSSGDISMSSVLIEGPLCLNTVSGCIRFYGSDAKSLQINSSSGDINGSLLTPKIFNTHTGSGEIHVADSDPAGGMCEITTSSGNIFVDIETAFN